VRRSRPRVRRRVAVARRRPETRSETRGQHRDGWRDIPTRQERRDRNRAIAVGVSVDVGVGTAVREAVYQPRHRQHLAVGSGLDDLRDNLPELEDRVDLALLEQPSEFDLRTGLDRRRRLVRIEAVELSTGRPDKDPVLVEASDDADSVARDPRACRSANRRGRLPADGLAVGVEGDDRRAVGALAGRRDVVDVDQVGVAVLEFRLDGLAARLEFVGDELQVG